METGKDTGEEVRIRTGNADELRSLLDWLRREDVLRPHVRIENLPVGVGEMGGLVHALVIAAGAGGALTVLAGSVSTWLNTRRSTVELTITRPDGHTIELSATNVSDAERLIQDTGRLMPKEDG